MILRDAGNLIVHLSPFPIVARVANLSEGDDPNFWRTIWSYEIKVATHPRETRHTRRSVFTGCACWPLFRYVDDIVGIYRTGTYSKVEYP